MNIRDASFREMATPTGEVHCVASDESCVSVPSSAAYNLANGVHAHESSWTTPSACTTTVAPVVAALVERPNGAMVAGL